VPERRSLFDVRSLAEPLVQAPLAGGPSTPELAVAVCEAGGLGFLAAGYKQADAVRAEIAQVRAATERPFGVNIFVPTPRPADPEVVRAYLATVPDAGEPRFDDDDWERKLALAAEARVAVVSFAFGCPPRAVVAALHAVDVAVWVTITTPAEAVRAQAAGADALVVQGSEAGGHRGGFADADDADVGLLALLRLVARATALPLIATGGVADGAALAAVLCAGASAAQIGTALMLTPEAATNPAQRAALQSATPTRLTRAFSGRLARGIVNRFLEEHSAGAPSAYPEVHHATSALRAQARAARDGDGFNLWAGQAHALAEERPAAEIVRALGADARRVLRETAARASS
jgi:nitronate monooxygenase